MLREHRRFTFTPLGRLRWLCAAGSTGAGGRPLLSRRGLLLFSDLFAFLLFLRRLLLLPSRGL